MLKVVNSYAMLKNSIYCKVCINGCFKVHFGLVYSAITTVFNSGEKNICLIKDKPILLEGMG